MVVFIFFYDGFGGLREIESTLMGFRARVAFASDFFCKFNENKFD